LAETQELTVMQQWKEWLATIPDGKLPTNQKTEGQQEDGICQLVTLFTSANPILSQTNPIHILPPSFLKTGLFGQ